MCKHFLVSALCLFFNSNEIRRFVFWHHIILDTVCKRWNNSQRFSSFSVYRLYTR